MSVRASWIPETGQAQGLFRPRPSSASGFVLSPGFVRVGGRTGLGKAKSPPVRTDRKKREMRCKAREKPDLSGLSQAAARRGRSQY